MLGVYKQAFVVFFGVFFSDLTKPETFRDLSKPVGALNKERLDRLVVCIAWHLCTEYLCLVHIGSKRSFVQQALGIMSYELLYQKLTVNFIRSKQTYNSSTFIFQLHFIRAGFVSTNLKLFESISSPLLPFHMYIL